MAGLGDGAFRVIARSPAARAAALAALPAAVIDLFDIKTTTDVLQLLDNQAARSPKVALCAAALASLQAEVGNITGLASALAGNTGDQLLARFNSVISAKRAAGRTALADHKKQVGDQAIGVWFLTPTVAGTRQREIQNSVTICHRFAAYLGEVQAVLSATSPGASHNHYWYLNEHLRRRGGDQVEPRIAAYLTELEANAVGFAARTRLEAVVAEATYRYLGLGQGGITVDGKPMGKRGAGILETVTYRPPDDDSRQSWMPHLDTLRGLSDVARHAHATLRPERHTTDPAKLGEAGSVDQGSEAKNTGRTGGKTLTGQDKGWEYTIPNFSGARLIEVPRSGPNSWYVSLGHYNKYQLIVNLP
ncbi:MAG TPA: hypothetical protein VGM69_12305 [Chloroflexota bacterium]